MSAISSKHRLIKLLPMALLALGCTHEVAGDDASESENVAEVAQAFTGISHHHWGTTEPANVDIGSAVNRTCFLYGVAGNLTQFSPFNNVAKGAWARRVGDNYRLIVDAHGLPVSGNAICVDSARGRTEERSWASTGPLGNQPATLLASVTAARRCFLTKVITLTPSPGFAVSTDYIRVWRDNFNWYLGGVQSGRASASAVCIDIGQDHGGWQWGAPDPGMRMDPLAYDPGGVACMLTGIRGRMNGNEYDDGVLLGYQPGIREYFMTTKNGKTGWAACVKGPRRFILDVAPGPVFPVP